jgi:hypothetical protein
MSNIIVRTVCPYCHKEQRDSRVTAEISPDQSVVILSMTLRQCKDCYETYVISIPETFDTKKIEN